MEDSSEIEKDINFDEEPNIIQSNLNINNEREYQKNYLIKNYIYIPDKCPQCGHTNITLGNNNKLLNPIRMVCNNYKCLYRTNIRKYSFLKNFPKIPGSLLLIILKKIFIEERNANQIFKFLPTTIQFKLSQATILKIISYFRRIIAHHPKDIYRFHKLGQSNGGSLISVDESLFVKQNGTNIWIIGAKNNKTLNIRLDLFTCKTEEDCKNSLQIILSLIIE